MDIALIDLLRFHNCLRGSLQQLPSSFLPDSSGSPSRVPCHSMSNHSTQITEHFRGCNYSSTLVCKASVASQHSYLEAQDPISRGRASPSSSVVEVAFDGKVGSVPQSSTSSVACLVLKSAHNCYAWLQPCFEQ